MKIPEMRINFADLLYFQESQALAGKNTPKSYEEYEQKTAKYRKTWEKYEHKILTTIQEVIGVRFYKTVIDVHCAPYFVPKSSPLIMNFAHDPEQFVDVLTHELCHVLFTDNNVLQIHNHKEPKPLSLIKEWQNMFGESLDFDALVHVPVHALCKYIYLDVLKQPERLSRDVKDVETYVNANSYIAAWKYVNDRDYLQILDNLKKMYLRMA